MCTPRGQDEDLDSSRESEEGDEDLESSRESEEGDEDLESSREREDGGIDSNSSSNNWFRARKMNQSRTLPANLPVPK